MQNPQALAVFWYLDNRNESWKTSGIKDEDIEEIHFCPECGTEELGEETRYGHHDTLGTNYIHAVDAGVLLLL